MGDKNTNTTQQRLWGIEQLSLRSLLIGALGSCMITASSMYIALRMSALPWPTIFVAVLSMALLKALGKTNLNEINVTQTAMSAGAMVAGGLAFTLPGLWITGTWGGPAVLTDHLWRIIGIALAGMLLGTVLTWLLRPRFVEREGFPYPIGMAAAQTLTTGDQGGRKSIVLFGTMGFSALFTYLRDSLGWIPGAFVSRSLYARDFFVGVWVSPMAVSIGYLIGSLYTGVWFLGTVLAYLFIIPIAPRIGLFPSVEEAVAFKNIAGIGLMVGTGLGIILSFLITFIKGRKNRRIPNASTLESRQKNISSKGRFLVIAAVAAAYLLTLIAGLSPVVSILLVLGVFAATTMAATITGQTGINPMEVFGIIILLAIRLFVPVDITAAFFITACVAIACGYAGDLFNDYKAGQILRTNPAAQLISQIVGGMIGVVVASVAMVAIITQYGGVGQEAGLPAAQAFAVSQMVNGIGDPWVFTMAVVVGALLYLIKVPSMTLGLGMYLPFEIGAAVFIGGAIRYICDRFRPKSSETGNVAASGVFGGEGIAGVTVAIVKMITGA